VSDTQQPGAQQPEQHDNSGWIILGVVLVVVGFFLGAQSLGLVHGRLPRCGDSYARPGLAWGSSCWGSL